MSEDAAFLKAQAHRCRRLARAIATPDVAETLNRMAADYDARAEAGKTCPPHAQHGEGDPAKRGGGVIDKD
jgi:hypothetical protein